MRPPAQRPWQQPRTQNTILNIHQAQGLASRGLTVPLRDEDGDLISPPVPPAPTNNFNSHVAGAFFTGTGFQGASANAEWDMAQLVESNQLQPSSSDKAPHRVTPSTSVYDQVRELYQKNMSSTRQSVGLSFAPQRPSLWRLAFSKPWEYVPIFQPRENRRVWHWIVFLFGVMLLVLLGAALASQLEAIVNIAKYRQEQQYLVRLPPLPVRQPGWMFQTVNGDRIKNTTLMLESEEQAEVTSLSKYIVDPMMRAGDERWEKMALLMADELVIDDKKKDVWFIGDLFEEWRGAERGESCPDGSCSATKLLIDKDFEPNTKAISAVRGETTQNLLWRITQVEGFNGTAPYVVVLQIGTADLAAGRQPEEVGACVREVLRQLQARMPDSHFLLLGLLPRADDVYAQMMSEAQGVERAITRVPFDGSIWFNPIFRVNRWLQKLADGVRLHKHTQETLPPVTFLDCSKSMLVPGERRVAAPPREEIPVDYMPDLIHLSPTGHEHFANCMRKDVQRLIDLARKDEQSNKNIQRRQNRKQHG